MGGNKKPEPHLMISRKNDIFNANSESESNESTTSKRVNHDMQVANIESELEEWTADNPAMESLKNWSTDLTTTRNPNSELESIKRRTLEKFRRLGGREERDFLVNKHLALVTVHHESKSNRCNSYDTHWCMTSRSSPNSSHFTFIYWIINSQKISNVFVYTLTLSNEDVDVVVFSEWAHQES